MKSTENKNRKPKTSNLPLSMGAGLRAGLKIGAVALGFHLFGSGFVWGRFWPFCSAMTSCGVSFPVFYLSSF